MKPEDDLRHRVRDGGDTSGRRDAPPAQAGEARAADGWIGRATAAIAGQWLARCAPRPCAEIVCIRHPRDPLADVSCATCRLAARVAAKRRGPAPGRPLAGARSDA